MTLHSRTVDLNAKVKQKGVRMRHLRYIRASRPWRCRASVMIYDIKPARQGHGLVAHSVYKEVVLDNRIITVV